MGTMQKLKKYLLPFLLLGIIAMMSACTGDTNTNSVTNPDPNTLMPVGTIQGILIDKCTNQPIANATVDIGVAQAVTTVDGQFVLRNVPATKGPEHVNGTYQVTINLKAVNAALAASAPKYPDFVFDCASVVYTDLGDAGKDTSSNHATPVDYLAQGVKFYAGKAASTIKGKVLNGKSFVPGANYTVTLTSLGSNASQVATGGAAWGMNVGTVTTDATGAFAFTNVEAGQQFKITATSAAGDFSGCVTPVCSDCDGGTVNAGNVLVFATDTLCPIINATTPFNNSDIDPVNNTVTFTFSKPIKANAKNSGQGLTASDTTGLYSLINVEFLGNKAGNIPYTVSTNLDSTTNTFTTITVTIPNLGAAGSYSVTLPAGAASLLKDASGNVLADSATNCTAFSGKTVSFTTFGSIAAAQPQNLTVTNTPLDFNDTINLGWDVAVGAKSYNVYCGEIQVYNSTQATNHQAFLVGNTTNTFFNGIDPKTFSAAPEFSFVEGRAIALQWKCFVTGISADKIESTPSAPATAADTVGPILVDDPANTYLSQVVALAGGGTTFVLTFDEPLNAASANTAANYAISPTGYAGTPPTVTKAVYDPATLTVKLTLSGPLDPLKINHAFIDSGANGINESAFGGTDTLNFAAGNGLPNTTCVAAGPNGIIDSVPAGDDAIVGNVITSGPDGICNTTAAGDDVQTIPVGKGLASQSEIVAGSGLAGLTLGSTAGGDDKVHTVDLLVVTGVTDVAGNVIRTIGDAVTSDGQVD